MKVYIAIYDFGLLPYALGDVITFCVKTAIRAQVKNCQSVDVHLVADPREPSFKFQKSYVDETNYQLFLAELYPAFLCHPMLGNLFVYANRIELQNALSHYEQQDVLDISELIAYREVLASSPLSVKRPLYVIEQVQSHNEINSFFYSNQAIPRLNLRTAEGDFQFLNKGLFLNKTLILIQPRFRQINPSLGGKETYNRDSNYIEWYRFLEESGREFPEVVFVILGRITEIPLSILRLSNVINLRAYGGSLLHELAAFNFSSLFLGASSGFAAVANFSDIPYFILNTPHKSCQVYDIPFGQDKLPFASSSQLLLYGSEDADNMLFLLSPFVNTKNSRVALRDEKHSDCTFPNFFNLNSIQDAKTNYTLSRLDNSCESESFEKTLLLQSQIKSLFLLYRQGATVNKIDNSLAAIRAYFSNQFGLCTEFWRLSLLHYFNKREISLALYCAFRLYSLYFFLCLGLVPILTTRACSTIIIRVVALLKLFWQLYKFN